MKARGSVVESISNFIKVNFPNRYDEWISTLPPSSKAIYTNELVSKEWYPLVEAVITPTECIADLFYDDIETAAWSSGRYSAELALKGLYNVFVLIHTPSFIIDRAQNILPSFYEPTKMNVVENEGRSITVHVTELPMTNKLLEHRIGGWMERAMEICGCKSVSVQITRSMEKDGYYAEYKVKWLQE